MTTSLARVDPRLDDLLSPRGPVWTPRQLSDLTSTVAARFAEPLLGLVRFASPHRWWSRLALTDEVELWLLSWLPGQGTAPHDHGGASGAFSVLLGELAETYRYPARAIQDERHVAGATVGFGAGRAHVVQNRGSGRAVSVHAYSPPLVPTREYASLSTLEPVGTMSAIDDVLAAARAQLNRVEPEQAELLQARGALLVDIRPHVNRATEGEIPGAVPIERIHLEWRLDPHGEHRLPGVTEQRVVIVFCNEGYASSLAARDLQRLGLPHATDLVGGYRAWRAAGLPTQEGGTPAVP